MTRITLRLYRRHDIDLISLYKHPDFGFKTACVNALRAYINKKPYFIKQPTFTEPKEFKYGYQLFIVLDDNKDKDIIDYLKKVKPRYQNEFIKMVLRGSVIGPVAYNCFEDESDGAGRPEIINYTPFVLQDYPVKTRKKTSSDEKLKTKPVEQKVEPVVVPAPTPVPKPALAPTPMPTVEPAPAPAPMPISTPVEENPVEEPTSKEPQYDNNVDDTAISQDDFDMFGSIDKMMNEY